MSKLRYACLFSGIGAPLQGAYRVYGKENIEHVFSCEYDKFARQSFEANYDIAPEHFHKDVNDLDATQYKGKVDILIGGSPCQAFSIAGLRNGTEDVRGQLIYQYIRVVEECMPPVIVYENVKGMMSITGGRTIKEFVQALRDIGYYCHYKVINTKDYGVPQNRERLFLVGFLDHDTYHRFEYAPKIKLEKRLKDVLEEVVDEKYYLSGKAITYITDAQRMAKKFTSLNGEESQTIMSQYSQSSPGTFLCVDSNGKISDSEVGTITSRYHKGAEKFGGNPFIQVLGLLDIKGTDQIRRVYGTDGIASTLTTMQGGNQEPKIQVPSATKQGYETATTGDSINLSVPNSKTRRGRVGKQVAQCLDTACNQAVVSGRIRKLTPRECLRLQDFHDTFKVVVSDSQAYKQAGNSMSVNILEMIFTQIEKAKSNEKTNTLFDFLGETA